MCLSFQQRAARNMEKINRRIAFNTGFRAVILILLAKPMISLVVSRLREDLVRVPADIDPAVTRLDLSHNNIERICVTSLDAFEHLSILLLTHNSIRFIEEGAFDNNRFLTELHLSCNRIDMMTSSFGASKNSLVTIYLWQALTAKAIAHANFSECNKLEFLNIGANPYFILDVSILSHNLIELALNYMELSEFPDLRYETPYIEILHLQNNRIYTIPSERIMGLNYIKTIFSSGNMLQILPDLTSTDITKLSLAGNPWLCNSFLCHWYMLPNLTIEGDAPTCETPTVYRGQMVLNVDSSLFACGTSKTFIMW